jgi:hypothetical protein
MQAQRRSLLATCYLAAHRTVLTIDRDVVTLTVGLCFLALATEKRWTDSQSDCLGKRGSLHSVGDRVLSSETSIRV